MDECSTNAGLPKAADAERYIIGCIAAWPDHAGEILRLLRPADFVDHLHVKLWRAFQRQYAAGGVDVTLAARELDCAGYTLELAADCVTTVHAQNEAAKVIEASSKRRLHEIAQHAAECSLNGRSSESVYYELKCALADFGRDPAKPSERFILRDLCAAHPRLNPPVVDGLFRAGETINIISHSKAGKSWFGYGLALSIIAGNEWLGCFRTTAGRVLLIDNELHRSTLAHRIPAVGDATGLPRELYDRDLHVWPLRGNLRSLADLATDLEEVEAGEFALIILDAKYRFAVAGQSENDNASETLLYNTVDRIAERTGAAIALIHHTSKGIQSDKRTTDVGAGAGAQSRAADCHLILREHEEDGLVVLEAAVRSFKPVEPLVLRWEFPLWLPVDGADPTMLKGRGTANEERQNQKDREGMDATIKALREGPSTCRNLRRKTGFGDYRQQRLLDLLTSQGHAKVKEKEIGSKVFHEYQLSE